MNQKIASLSTIDSETLIASLREPDEQEAWRRVDDRYGPLLRSFARRCGLAADAAEDAAQESLFALCRAIRQGKYERRLGRLRDYLFTIARNKIIDSHRAGRDIQPGKSAWLYMIPDDADATAAWEAEWARTVSEHCLREAQAQFSESTYEAFSLRCLQDLSSAEAAQRLGKSVSAIDTATHRVRAFLRQIRPIIEERL